MAAALAGSYELTGEHVKFRLVTEDDGSLRWEVKDSVSGLCEIRGFQVGRIVQSDGKIWTLAGPTEEGSVGNTTVRKTKIQVPAIGSKEGLLITSKVGRIGEVEIAYVVSGNRLLSKVTGKGVLEDVDLKEIVVWDGELILGDGRQGYDDLYTGYLVDGMFSPWVAVLIAILAAIAYTLISIYATDVNDWHLFYHYIVVCLILVPASTGLYGGMISGPRSMYLNGWQSWSFCGSVKMGNYAPMPALHHVFTRSFHAGANADKMPPYTVSGRKMRYFSDMFTAVCDTNIRVSAVVGFLSQRKHFGAVDFDRIMRTGIARCPCDNQKLSPGMTFETDWLIFETHPFVPEEPLKPYCDLVASANPLTFKSFGDTPIGWCSWYHYFTGVTAEDLYTNLDHLMKTKSKLPLDVFQLDDGYQTFWGDWTPNKKFPSDMNQVSAKIKEHGFKAGIWLAPFSADKGSEVSKKHPDWILRKKNGRVANSGNPGKFFYGLDASKPEVLEHATHHLKKLTQEWGFTYLKLDFLYSCILADSERFDRTRTRAEIFDNALKVVRAAVGKDVFLVGCGCPLGSGVGYFNAMRVGPDVDKRWYAFIPWDKWNLPGARNGIRNALTRISMHRSWWVNDPDCVLYREATLFSEEQIVGISTAVGMSGGMLMLSDEMAGISEKRFRIASSLMPPAPKAAIPLDLFENQSPTELVLRLDGPAGDWTLLALCNWGDQQIDKTFQLSKLFPSEEKPLHLYEFWSQTYQVLNSTAPLISRVPAYTATLFAIREMKEDSLQYVGSSIHFTSGLEVKGLKKSGRKFEIDLNVKRNITEAEVVLHVPFDGEPKLSGTAYDETRESLEMSTRVWKLPVTLKDEGGRLTVEKDG